MRTTLTIDDQIARQLKAIAHETDASFKQVVNDTLRRGLPAAEQRAPARPYRLKPLSLGEPAPGYDLDKALAIAEHLEADELEARRRQRKRRFSNREAIAQVVGLAHREKLPETTAALGVYLNGWEDALDWIDFEQLVQRWISVAPGDLDTDRVGVFWALLFLSSQGAVELQQEGWLHAPLRLKRIPASGSFTQLPITRLEVPDPLPTRTTQAA